jgi:two-component system, OmpR family, phosphate regulon sensor histidine kinase PhoR
MTRHPATILLIEDDPITSFAWQRRLEAQGHRVVAVADGFSGVCEAIAHEPDLVLLDKELPGLHGHDVCRSLRSYHATRSLPILMISADAEVPDRIQGMDAGADDYLGKNISDGELASRVRSFLRIKDLQDEVRAERDKLDTVLRNLHEPVVICDGAGRILVASTAFLHLMRLPREIAHMQTLDDVLAALAVPPEVRLQLRVADAEPVKLTVAPAGEEISLEGRAAPIHLVDQETVAYIFRDITQQLAHERMQADFHSMVAHDLRSPLAVIQGYAALIASGKAGPVTPTQQDFLTHVLHKVDDLSELLSDFLEISRIEAGYIDLEIEDTPLGVLISDCVAELGSSAREKRLTVSLDVTPPDLTLGCDPLRLRQIIQNLLSNAVKYNQADGWIRIAVWRHEQNVVLEIGDGGIGLTPAEQAELFRPYRRGRAERRIKGVGLGLAIVKKLVEAHDGHISVASRPGEGTSFTVVLPSQVPTAKSGRPLAAPVR